MKRAFLFLSIFISLKCCGQDVRYKAFFDYVNSNFKPGKSVNEICGWQLAMIRLTTDRKGKVTRVDALNTMTDNLRAGFNFLQGYQFADSLHMRKKSVVFCQTLQNWSTACITQRQTTGDDAILILYPALIKQIREQPQTIFLDDIFMMEILSETQYKRK